MIKRFLIIIFVFLPYTLIGKGLVCLKSGQISKIVNKKEITTKEGYCFNNSRYKLFSYDCLDLKCLAFDGYKIVKKVKMQNSMIGTIYHRKCRYAGGVPKIIKYYTGSKWKSTSICRFKDGSFVSVFNRIGEF